MPKLKKIICEICGVGEGKPEILDLHHIIPRSQAECSNSKLNLVVLCKFCHSKLHLLKDKLVILGTIPSTKLPYGRTVIYEIDGKRNINVEPIKPPALPSIKIPEKK